MLHNKCSINTKRRCWGFPGFLCGCELSRTTNACRPSTALRRGLFSSRKSHTWTGPGPEEQPPSSGEAHRTLWDLLSLVSGDREAKKQGTGGEGESPHSLCTRTEANLDSRAVGGRKARGPRETLIVVNTISGDSTGLPRKLRDGTYGSWLGKGLVWPNTIQYVVKTK